MNDSVYDVKIDPTPCLAASSFLHVLSPITAWLYSGLHCVSFCVLIFLTGIDRKEMSNVRMGGTNRS